MDVDLAKSDHDRTLFDLSLGIMVYFNGKSSLFMAARFRLVNYYHLPRESILVRFEQMFLGDCFRVRNWDQYINHRTLGKRWSSEAANMLENRADLSAIHPSNEKWSLSAMGMYGCHRSTLVTDLWIDCFTVERILFEPIPSLQHERLPSWTRGGLRLIYDM